MQGTFVLKKSHLCKFLKNLHIFNFTLNNSAVKMSTEKKAKLHDCKIGTHDGTFHCDEVVACYMLKQLPQYSQAKIIRTRNPELLAECDIVVDVGGIFDPTTHKYDHHQRVFTDTMSSLSKGKYPWMTKLSSAGLIYAHFGHDVIAEILNKPRTSCEKLNNANLKVQFDEKLIDLIYRHLYEGFFNAVDSIDNGIDIAETNTRYKIATDISSRVGHLNLPWNHPDTNNKLAIEAQFEKAISLVGLELDDRILYYADVWWPARSLVESALESRGEVDVSKEIMLLGMGGCPWKDHLTQLEQELQISPPIKYIIYPDSNASWRVQCVPKSKDSFENRLSLPAAWRGLRDEELSKTIGIRDCIFVHASGFIGGHKEKEGVLYMARKALELSPLDIC